VAQDTYRYRRETLEIRAIEVTSTSIGDAPMLPDLLHRIPPDQELGSVIVDDAYDHANAMIRLRLITPTPSYLHERTPRCGSPILPGAEARNEAVRSSKYLGRALWRHLTGHHRPSRVETKMHLVKLLGQRLTARDFDRQVAEIHIRAAILNGFTALGIPRPVVVD
jgi:hypothetical protein